MSFGVWFTFSCISCLTFPRRSNHSHLFSGSSFEKMCVSSGTSCICLSVSEFPPSVPPGPPPIPAHNREFFLIHRTQCFAAGLLGLSVAPGVWLTDGKLITLYTEPLFEISCNVFDGFEPLQSLALFFVTLLPFLLSYFPQLLCHFEYFLLSFLVFGILFFPSMWVFLFEVVPVVNFCILHKVCLGSHTGDRWGMYCTVSLL